MILNFASLKKFLVIQTAFIGDVVLATGVVEKLRTYYPAATIDFLLRKGNEGLLKDNLKLNNVWIWDKKNEKNKNLLRIIKLIRLQKYTHVINLHRFSSSGLITFLSGAPYKIGFDKNPFSFCYTTKIRHIISKPFAENPIHETDRNHALIAHLTDTEKALPKLYPSEQDYKNISQYQTHPYICIASASVWFTKQFPYEKWIELIDRLPSSYQIFLLGAPADENLAQQIIANTQHKNTVSLCGKLNFLESAALMKNAVMNYANDSAPLHFASAVNAPVTEIYCSTVPAFGFYPLSEKSKSVEIAEQLSCRPCGLHGYAACPEGHFNCAKKIHSDQLLWWL